MREVLSSRMPDGRKSRIIVDDLPDGSISLIFDRPGTPASQVILPRVGARHLGNMLLDAVKRAGGDA